MSEPALVWRIALAIDPEAFVPSLLADDYHKRIARNHALGQAQAALAECLTPTRRMIDAGAGHDLSGTEAAAAWQRMIQAEIRAPLEPDPLADSPLGEAVELLRKAGDRPGIRRALGILNLYASYESEPIG